MGVRCGGAERSSGFSVRIAPHLCAPRRAAGLRPLFLPRRRGPALRCQAPSACLGGSWEPGCPADPEDDTSRAAAASRNHGLWLPNSLSFQATRRRLRRRRRARPHAAGVAGLPQPLPARSLASFYRYSTLSPFFSQRHPFDTELNQNKNFIFFVLFCFSECEQQGM